LDVGCQTKQLKNHSYRIDTDGGGFRFTEIDSSSRGLDDASKRGCK